MSCAAKYNNQHKKHGTRRSKLEIWLEETLTKKYPDICFIFNGKEAIGSELDIYVPSKNIAFEINGIFHYMPIYGQETLDAIQSNDAAKAMACAERKITLHIIDTRDHKYFTTKDNSLTKYLTCIEQYLF